MRAHGQWIIFLALIVCSCGADPGTDGGATDAGRSDAGPSPCARDLDCDEGRFCAPRACIPGDPGADARGCVAAAPPCAEGELCDEVGARCVDLECGAISDGDRDGYDSIACGGADCDDGNPARFPGNVEVCDGFGRDEDCDPSTLGIDVDGDEHPGASCCNAQPDGSILCGADCDDTRPSVAPGGVEVCNGLDEDCDGSVDEGVLATLYRDSDGDGFGSAATAAERPCGDPLYVADGTDCDDGDPAIRPGASEVCDGRDNDCDGDPGDEIDADGDRHLAAASSCAGGPLPSDDCRDDDLTVNGGAADVCNDVDDDCDGSVDERATADPLCTTGAARASAVCAFSGYPALGNACLITSCEPGYANCDADVGNGCEVDTRTDASHCGSCDRSCAAGPCVAGLCASDGDAPAQIAMYADGGAMCARSIGGGIACRGDAFLTPGRLVPLNEDDGRPVDDAVDVTVSTVASVCFVRESGRVACAGNGSPGRAVSERGLIDVVGIEGATRLAQGMDFLCALTPSSVRCHGDDSAGQLGNGSAPASGTVDALAPDGGSLVATDLSARWQTACAVEALTDRVLCWGENTNGILAATGSLASRDAPTPILDSSDVPLSADRVFVSTNHACALRGTAAYCWGYNDAGQASPGNAGSLVTRAQRLAAVDGTPLEVHDLALGAGRTCIRRADLSWACMGRNDSGESGAAPPGPVIGPGPSVAHEAYASFPASGVVTDGPISCGILDDWVHCWGSNASAGLLAPAGVSQTHLAIPARMPGSATGLAIGYAHACATTSGGRVLCWGRNEVPARQLALADSRSARVPVLIPVSGARAVAAGSATTCALIDAGTVECWGEGNRGQRGDGTRSGHPAEPTVVSGLSDAVAVGMGGQHGCAIRASGQVVCWGSNQAGALGDGAAHADCAGVDCSATPVSVVGLPSGVAAVQVAAGGLAIGAFSLAPEFSCARLADGTVWCWGSNRFGTLGDGTGADSAAPVQVVGIDDAIDLQVGSLHACVLRGSGVVSCWGAALGLASSRTFAPCADGVACARTPVDARTVGPARRLAVTHTGACTEGLDGAVRCWGQTTVGESSPFPGAPIPGVANLTFLAGGAQLACAGLTAGDVVCWGPGHRGALVDEDPPPAEPTSVVGL